MNFWEDIARNTGKFAGNAANFVGNPIKLRQAENTTNAFLGNIQNGLGGVHGNPLIGNIASAASGALQQGINNWGNISQTPLGQGIVKSGQVLGAATGNPLLYGAASAAGAVKPVTPEQLKVQQQNNQRAKSSYDTSLVAEEAALDLRRNGNSYDVSDVLAKSPAEAWAFLQGVTSAPMQAAAGATINAVQGKGFNYQDQYREQAAEIDREKVRNKNMIALGGFGKDLGRRYYATLSPEQRKLLTDQEKVDIYEGNVDSNTDFYEVERRTKDEYSLNAAKDKLEQEIREGKKTPEEADQNLSDVISGLQVRNITAESLFDVLNFIPGGQASKLKNAGNTMKYASRLVGKADDYGKAISNAAHQADEYGKIPSRVFRQGDEYKQPSNVLGKVDEYNSQATNNIEKIDKYNPNSTRVDDYNPEATRIDSNTSQVSKPIGTPKSPEELIPDTLQDQNKPFIGSIWEEANPKAKSVQSKVTKAVTNNPNPENVSSLTYEKKAEEIKNILEGADNKDAAEILIKRTSDDITVKADEEAGKLWSKISGAPPGTPVNPENLVVQYTPPRVDIGPKGTMVFNEAKQVAPVPLTFRNEFQKLMYQMSMPFNKNITQGYGMSHTDFQRITQEINEAFVKPLTQSIFGNTNKENMSRVSSSLGAIGSEIAKFSAKNPGVPIDFSTLGSSKKLDNLLLQANKSTTVRNSLAEGVQNLADLSKSERRMVAAESIISKRYNNVVEHFSGLGIDPDLAERAAPFYTKSLKARGLGNTQGMIVGADTPGITAGKAYSPNIYDDVNHAVTVELHEDTHQMFDYIRATVKDEEAFGKYVNNILFKDTPDATKRYLNKLVAKVKNVGTKPEDTLDEMVAYYVQAKEAISKGVAAQSSVVNEYTNLIYKARNGDDAAAQVLDKMDAITSFVRKNADEYEQNLVNELQQTILPDGTTAWDKINSLDPTSIKGTMPGEKYSNVRKSISEADNYLQDSTQRMNRMKELLGDQQHTFRGAPNKPSTGKLRVNYGSVDQMYGPGAYTSTNPAQAFGYAGLGAGELMDDITRPSLKSIGDPDFRSFYPSLERPLFWDEQVPLDIVTTLENSKNPTIKKAFEALGGVEGVSMYSMEEFVKDIQIAAQEILNPNLTKSIDPKDYQRAASKTGPLILEEVYKKAGYDGFIGPNTDEALGMTQGGFEVVPFESHNLMERASELRKADQFFKSPKHFVDPKKSPLVTEQYAMLTAENPGAKQLSGAENAARNKELVAELKSMGYEPMTIKGHYGGNPESSFMIPGLSQEDALALGKKYGQESVLTPKGLIYQDGSMNPADLSKINFDGNQADFYSVINVGGENIKFSIPIDFDKKIKPMKSARVRKSVVDPIIKDPKRTIDLRDDIKAIDNIQNRTKSGINYHINQGN